MPDLKFHTKVSGSVGEVHHVRNKPLGELVKSMSFPAAVFYMITGVEPSPGQEKIFNAILISSMDHGVGPSSGFVPRVVASTGNNLVHSMAAGLLTLGPYHGLAIADAAKVIKQVKDMGVTSLQASHFVLDKRIPGLGHPHYKHTDPRSEQLFEMTRELQIPQDHQLAMLSIQKAVYENSQKHLVINIDGAIAAILLDLGFPPEAGNGVFAVARAAGMIAHILEEQQERPVRRLEESDITFETEATDQEPLKGEQ